MTALFCINCGTKLPEQARFCPSCGKSLSQSASSPRFTTKNLPLVVVGTVICTTAVYFINETTIGKAPTQMHPFETSSAQSAQSPELTAKQDAPLKEDEETKKLREAVAKDPKDIKAKKALAQKLWVLATESANPLGSQTALELIDLLGQVVKETPKDSEAILLMANVSFNQKVFDKSASYYQQYLALQPNDYQVRASYASSLTFTGKLDDAVRELDAVIKAHPDFFQALAYKSIALAQQGKTDEAVKLGNQALAHAPSDEAKERFSAFVNSLKGQTTKMEPAPNGHTGESDDPVTQMIKTHPVSGPKYVSTKKEGSTLKIFFKEFPIDQTPEPMRNSFFAKIKVAAQSDSSIHTVELIDAVSGLSLGHIQVQ